MKLSIPFVCHCLVHPQPWTIKYWSLSTEVSLGGGWRGVEITLLTPSSKPAPVSFTANSLQYRQADIPWDLCWTYWRLRLEKYNELIGQPITFEMLWRANGSQLNSTTWSWLCCLYCAWIAHTCCKCLSKSWWRLPGGSDSCEKGSGATVYKADDTLTPFVPAQCWASRPTARFFSSWNTLVTRYRLILLLNQKPFKDCKMNWWKCMRLKRFSPP